MKPMILKNLHPKSEHVAAMEQGAKFCYVIIEDQFDEHGYIPSVVVENVSGHVPMRGNGVGASPWYWGKTLEAAYAAARSKNASLGVSEEEEARITLSSMRDVR